MATEKTEKLDCGAIRPLLSAFADSETTTTETARVERHLAVCASCASELAFARAMNLALFAAPREAPAPELFERIAAATYARPTLRERIAQWLTPAPTRWALGTALAAGLLLAVVAPRIIGRESATSSAGIGNREPGVVASVPSPALSVNVASLPKDEGIKDKREPYKEVSRPDKVAALSLPSAKTREAEKKTDSRIAVPVHLAENGKAATTNVVAANRNATNPVTKRPQTQVASLTPKYVKPIDAGIPPTHISTPIAKFAAKSPALFVAEVRVPKAQTPAAPVHIEPAPAPARTLEKPEPETRVAVQEPEPTPARQVAMVEPTRTAPSFSFRLKNAGVGRREISMPSPPNMRISDSASSFDGGRTRPLSVVGDNDNVASQK